MMDTGILLEQITFQLILSQKSPDVCLCIHDGLKQPFNTVTVMVEE